MIVQTAGSSTSEKCCSGGHFLGNGIIILNGNKPTIICSRYGH